jgi:hypothetical protein
MQQVKSWIRICVKCIKLYENAKNDTVTCFSIHDTGESAIWLSLNSFQHMVIIFIYSERSNIEF